MAGEIGEEAVVAVYVVIEAVDEDDFGFGSTIGLDGLRSVSASEAGMCQLTSHVLVYRDMSPIVWVPSTSVGILIV